METQGDRIVINGTDDTVNAVITLLARHRITAHQLRVGEATLDDAFLDLTDNDIGTDIETGTGTDTTSVTAPSAPQPEERV